MPGQYLTALRDHWKIAAFSLAVILGCALASAGASYVLSRKSAQTAVTSVVPVDFFTVERARMPCHAHGMHLFGYVLNVKRRAGENGAVCWDIIKQRWEWAFQSDSLRHLASDPNRK